MKKIPVYFPRWLSGFFSFLSRLPVHPLIVAIGVILVVGLALHIDVWRRGLIPPGEIAIELVAEGFWITFLPGLWLYLDKQASLALEGYFAGKGISTVDLEKRIADFLSLPNIVAASAFILGALFGVPAYLAATKASPLIISVAWETIPNFIFSSGFLFLIVIRAIRQTVLMARLFSVAEVDLFNPQPIFALSRYGSQSSLAIILMFYLLFLISAASDLESIQESLLTPALLSIQLILIGVGVILFFIPLGSVNRRMRVEKNRVLARYGGSLNRLYDKTIDAVDKQQFDQVKGIRDASGTLREGWDLVKKLPTWPWEPESLRNILAPLVFPILVFIIQRFISAFL